MFRISHLIGSVLLLALAGGVSAQQGKLLEKLSGEVAPGSLVIGKTRPGATVLLDGRELRLTADGHFVFGFGRDAEGLVGLTLRHEGHEESYVYELAERQWDIQRIEGVPQETVDPPSGELLERIREEVRLVREARRTDSDMTHFLNGFQWPLTGPITGDGAGRWRGDPGAREHVLLRWHPDHRPWLRRLLHLHSPEGHSGPRRRAGRAGPAGSHRRRFRPLHRGTSGLAHQLVSAPYRSADRGGRNGHGRFALNRAGYRNRIRPLSSRAATRLRPPSLAW